MRFFLQLFDTRVPLFTTIGNIAGVEARIHYSCFTNLIVLQ